MTDIPGVGGYNLQQLPGVEREVGTEVNCFQRCRYQAMHSEGGGGGGVCKAVYRDGLARIDLPVSEGRSERV